MYAVLPGVGAIHVVDSAVGRPVPKSSGAGKQVFDNFFVFDDSSANEMEVEGTNASAAAEDGDASKSPTRAEVACKYLCELNPDVSGDYTNVSSLSSANYGSVLDDIVKKQSTTPSPSLLVVASDLPPKPLLSLSREAWDRGIPLLIVRSCGMIGSVRLQVEDHPVVESKPDSTVPDLRLSDPSGPFPALKALVDATDMDSMDNAEHSHVPYVIILLKALAKWRSGLSSSEDTAKSDMLSGEVRFPKSTDEKESFRATIKSMARNYNDELNFQEACGDAYLAYAEREIPWEVQELLDATTDESVTATIQKFAASGAGLRNVRFAVLLLALKRFLAQSDGRWAPLDGKIPDMTASTGEFIHNFDSLDCSASIGRGIGWRPN